MPNIALIVGCGIALAVAVVAIYVDCYQRLSKRYPNVPSQFFSSFGMLVLAVLCGAVAAGAYLWTDPKGTGPIDKLLTLNIQNDFGRAFYVGGCVLILIRSKLFQFQGGDFGGEYFYNLGSQKALQSVVMRWVEWRDAFVVRIVPQSFADPNYDTTMLNLMREVAAVIGDATYRSNVESQINQVQQQRPATLRAAADPEWLRYHTAITRMTLEICGRRPLRNYQ